MMEGFGKLQLVPQATGMEARRLSKSEKKTGEAQATTTQQREKRKHQGNIKSPKPSKVRASHSLLELRKRMKRRTYWPSMCLKDRPLGGEEWLGIHEIPNIKDR